jgi:hypothetical protein
VAQLTIDPGWPTAPQACARHLGAGRGPASISLAPLERTLVRGSISVRVRFEEGLPDSQARIVFGYQPDDGGYLCAGLGGYGAQYVLDEWIPTPGILRPVFVSGKREDAEEAAPVELGLRVDIHGRKLNLLVDGVPVMSCELPRTVGNAAVGLFAWGPEAITFSDFTITRERPYAVAVMQFNAYEQIYGDVMYRPLTRAGLFVERLDERAAPEGILEDIRRVIRDADLVVAEISPPNENVFYEVGYAHASRAPTLLLVHEDRELPFDVRPERCVRYGDSEASRQLAGEKLVAGARAIGLIE